MKVLIVDDHPIVLAGCKLLMADEPGVRLIGAENAKSARALFTKYRPDVVVLDLNLPGDSATALMRQLMEQDSKVRIVIFTMNDDPLLAAQMLEAGAKGFVSKSEDPTCIVTAIREAAAYRFSISPVLAQKIATLRISPSEPVSPKISARERDILSLLAAGMSMSEIAASVNLSYKTVSATCKKLRARFDARTTVELIRIALLLGIC